MWLAEMIEIMTIQLVQTLAHALSFLVERLFARGSYIDVYKHAYGETDHGCDQVEF